MTLRGAGRAALIAALVVLGAGGGTSAADGADVVDVDLGRVELVEPATGTLGATVAVTLGEPMGHDVVVCYATSEADSSATSGVDYTRFGTIGAPRTLRIPAGSQQSSINVPIRADAAAEPDETVVVTTVAGVGCTAAAGRRGVVTLHDRAATTPGTVPIGVAVSSVIEPDVGTVKLQVGLSVPVASAAPMSVTLRHVGGDAVLAAGPGALVDARDFDQRVVTIPAGRTGATADIVVYGNRLAEQDNTIEIRVVPPPGTEVQNGTPLPTVIATIVDDDAGEAERLDTCRRAHERLRAAIEAFEATEGRPPVDEAELEGFLAGPVIGWTLGPSATIVAVDPCLASDAGAGPPVWGDPEPGSQTRTTCRVAARELRTAVEAFRSVHGGTLPVSEAALLPVFLGTEVAEWELAVSGDGFVLVPVAPCVVGDA